MTYELDREQRKYLHTIIRGLESTRMPHVLGHSDPRTVRTASGIMSLEYCILYLSRIMDEDEYGLVDRDILNSLQDDDIVKTILRA